MQFNQIRAIFYTKATEATEKKRDFFTKSKRENRIRESFLQRVKEKKRKQKKRDFYTKSKREKEKTEKEGFFLQRVKEKKRKQKKVITIEFFRWLRWLHWLHWLRWLKIHIFNLLETSRH